MDSSKSPTKPDIAEANQDLISSLPTVLTDKIFKRLPISMVAKTSVVSRKWRDNWLSHRYLVFDEDFLDEHDLNVVNIISTILFYHNGPIDEFFLVVPEFPEGPDMDCHLNQWLSSLSRTCVKKMSLINWCYDPDSVLLPYHIFRCKELVQLRLEYFVLNPPPTDFNGFAFLRSLELVNIVFKRRVLKRLIRRCTRLTVLILKQCKGLGHITIDIPSLESLVIEGKFKKLRFGDVERLTNISLSLVTENIVCDVESIWDLATSCELHNLTLGGRLCELLAAGLVAKSLHLAFNHLIRLSLTELNVDRVDECNFFFGMIQTCSHIKDLEISVKPTTGVLQHKVDCNSNHKLFAKKNYMLNHLIKVKFTGITGSSAELQIIEYVLAISAALEHFYFKCGDLDASSELMLSRDLLRLRRASSKAQLIYLKK